jgi:hypothetical protein
MIDVSLSGIDEIIAQAGALQGEVREALVRAVRKTSRWMAKRNAAELAKIMGVPQAEISRRIATAKPRRLAAGVEGRVFHGLDPIGWEYLDPRRLTKGVEVSIGASDSQAFIAPGRSSQKERVFRRRGASRLPLDRKTAKIADLANAYLSRDNGVAAKFREFFKMELEWARLKL